MTEEQKIHFVVDETIDRDIRYTESMGDNDNGTYRECALRTPDLEKPVSALKLYDFEQRFGGVAVQVEGVGDVSTDPEQRRKGYVSQLLRRTLEGAATRVDAMFLFGISGLYSKFGFVSCLGGSWFTLWLKGADRLAGGRMLSAENLRAEDLPAINAMFNAEHRERPWTRVRTDRVARRLNNSQSWRPSPETVVFRDGSIIRAYAVISGYGYGWGRESFNVIDSGADSPETAAALIADLRGRGIDRGVDTITVHAPPDSTIGRTVRLLGGEYHRNFNADGGGMGIILNRRALVETLEKELDRRCRATGLAPEVLTALASEEFVAEPGVLMRLLTGYWSWADALHAGEIERERYDDTMRQLFPGGGTPSLLEPFACGIDGY